MSALNRHSVKLVAIVLTKNEELHLARCLASLAGLVDKVIVVDCFSNDATVQIARQSGATVVQREWINHATQFNFALTLLEDDVDWVLRVDADEYVTAELAAEIRSFVPGLDRDIDGVVLPRSIVFQGRKIRFGGIRAVKTLRLFRAGRGRCENRWMDEHISVEGRTVEFRGEIVDHNLRPMSWWIDKHNRYASLEALEVLDREYGFLADGPARNVHPGVHAGFKRWLKNSVYLRLPMGLRALMYFIYRYIGRLGFLDGRAGQSFHFLQGLWYRYLVDTKVLEVQRLMLETEMDIFEAIEFSLGITLDQHTRKFDSQRSE